MHKLLHYLKPFSFIIILILALTFFQVQMELALPDYMSDIVTNGIEYGGIKDNTLLAVHKDEMDKYLLFVDEDKQDLVLNSYTLVQEGTDVKVANQLINFKDDIYVLNEDSDPTLKDILLYPMVYTSLINKFDESGMTFEQISQNPSIKDQIVAKLDEQIKPFKDNISSAAILIVKDEYQSIGLDTNILQTNYILHTGLEMLLIAFLSAAALIGSTFLAVKVATQVAKNIRFDIFSKVESFSSAEFSKFSSSSLITRTTNDIQQIQMLIQLMLRMVLMAPLMGITALFKVFRYPDMLWILLIALIVITILMVVTLVIAMPKFKSIQGMIDKLNNVMREFLDGMLVIRAFNSEKHEEKRFDKANSDLSRTNLFVERVMSTVMPIMMLVMNVVTVLIVWAASSLIDINVMSVGSMMAFIQYATQVLMSFMVIAMIWVMIPRALVSVKRVFEVLDMVNSINDKEKVLTLPNDNGVLEFKNVSFKYPNAEEYVLENISFKANPEETIAFIGSTGSGKSTLVKLVPRLYDVSEGSISYCGIDIRDVSQKDLRDKIGFVSQKAVLFTGDIKHNIEFGSDVSEENLTQAIEVSQSKGIIEAKEDGINALITQGGTNVSGGQKQRISIARALARNANIFIFDDSFSALDYKTDKKLREDLNAMIKKTKATVLIVAQRISTIKNADRIIVLDEGKIVGSGTHKELLKSCKIYQEIARSQLSEEELAHA